MLMNGFEKKLMNLYVPKFCEWIKRADMLNSKLYMTQLFNSVIMGLYAWSMLKIFENKHIWCNLITKKTYDLLLIE